MGLTLSLFPDYKIHLILLTIFMGVYYTTSIPVGSIYNYTIIICTIIDIIFIIRGTRIRKVTARFFKYLGFRCRD